MPDGSYVERFYNETSYPSAATPGAAGQTVRARDPWGRERWARFDEQNRLVEVVEPDPNGNGAVASGGMKTNYSYDTLGNLTLVTQGNQTRGFKYDSLGRLTNQKLAEREATLNDNGVYVTTGQWSDVFSYDTRSNLVWRVDARGVKTIFNYNNDPLNRLQSVQYDKSGVPSSLIGNIPDAATVTYSYVTTGEKMRLSGYAVAGGMGSETFGYDSQGRLSQATQTFTGRESHPLVKNYSWDTLDRMGKLTYPMRYDTADTARREMTLTYDLASRVDSLRYDDAETGQVFASNPLYNAASQTESLTIGSSSFGSRLTESYTYDARTGLLTAQRVTRASDSAIFLDLQYNYTLTNDWQNNGAKTGQLTGITDTQNQLRNRAYEYDKLGRLKKVKGGTGAFYTPDWRQDYGYDRYGNRTTVTKTGNAPQIPLDGLASLSYTNGQGQTLNNRITSANFTYDPAGNQTRAVVDAGGAQQQYRYDAAGRLAQVLNADGSAVLATYSYGAGNQRLMSVEGGVTTYYGWDGGQVIGEYEASGASGLLWKTGYVYLGGRLLATTNANGTRFHHPDRLGTNVVTDQSNGELVTKQMGLPYGTQQPTGVGGGDNSWQHSSKTNPSRKRFTSYDRSAATGLDYAVNRHYSSAQGRFTQVDPIGMSAASLEDPQTLNLYSYCGNDPINRLDPDGLLSGWLKKLFNVVLKIAAVIVTVAAVLATVWTGNPFIAIAFWKLWVGAGALWASAYGAGKLSQILGGIAGFGKSINFRTPPINNGEGVSGVNNFLQEQKKKKKMRPLPTPIPTPLPQGPYIAKENPYNLVGQTQVGEPGYEVGECAAVVKKYTGAPATYLWRQGDRVRGNQLPMGTAIATFDERGRFPSKTGYHSAIYLYQDEQGIWVVEQFPGAYDGTIGMRRLNFGGSGRPNNGDNFCVIK